MLPLLHVVYQGEFNCMLDESICVEFTKQNYVVGFRYTFIVGILWRFKHNIQLRVSSPTGRGWCRVDGPHSQDDWKGSHEHSSRIITPVAFLLTYVYLSHFPWSHCCTCFGSISLYFTCTHSSCFQYYQSCSQLHAALVNSWWWYYCMLGRHKLIPVQLPDSTIYIKTQDSILITTCEQVSYFLTWTSL